MTTYYLAGSFAARDHLIEYRDRLIAADIPITATWLTEDPDTADLRTWALVDLMDIDSADGLILCTEWPSTSRGMWVELGYAMGRHKRVIGVGPKSNLFCEMAHEWYASFDELLAALAPKVVMV